MTRCNPCGPFRAWPIACPPPPPRYVVPGSQRLDPPYSWLPWRFPPQWVGRFPMPRMPWCFESETRAPGTGLISGPGQLMPCPPPPPLPPAPWMRPHVCHRR